MPSCLHQLLTEDVDVTAALPSRSSLSRSEQPHQQYRVIQKARDGIIAGVVQSDILSRAESTPGWAGLLSICAEHCGDIGFIPFPSQTWDCDSVTRWFGYLSVNVCEQRAVCPIRVSAASRCRRERSTRPFLPEDCVQTSHTLASELHHLEGRREVRYPLWRRPFGLSRADGKTPDGVTLMAWAKGKALTRDASVVDRWYIQTSGSSD